MTTKINQQNMVYELANYLINLRGYVVIAEKFGLSNVGDVVHVLWNRPIEHPIRLIAKTDWSDWKEQSNHANAHFPKKFKKQYMAHNRNRGSVAREDYVFYRAITD